MTVRLNAQTVSFTLVVVAILVCATATACEHGVTVNYVNNSDRPVVVDINNGGGRVVKPHTTSDLFVIGRDQDPYVVTITDEQGNVLYHEETTFGDIKKRNQPIVIGQPALSPTPT